MRNTIISFCLLFLVSSCCSTKIDKYEKEQLVNMVNEPYKFPDREPPKIKILKIDDLNLTVALFPKDYGSYSQMKNQFEPTISNIKWAENKIYKEAGKINKREKLKDYKYRQYQGRINENGEKILYINLLDFEGSCRKNSSDYFLFDKYFIDMFDINNDPYRDIEILTLEN